MSYSESQTAEIEHLSSQLSAILETIEQMENKEKPYLLALYQASLGNFEYELLKLQVECRALQQRIELATAKLNRGESLTEQHLQAIETQVLQELASWYEQLKQQAQAVKAGVVYLNSLSAVDDKTAQRAKQLYRRLARLLHPDVSPENQVLFERYWQAVQDAYRQIDAELLDALLQLVESAALQTRNTKETHDDMIARLKTLNEQQCERWTHLLNQMPFCWATQLQDKSWICERQAALQQSIAEASQHWTLLMARHAQIVALAMGA